MWPDVVAEYLKTPKNRRNSVEPTTALALNEIDISVFFDLACHLSDGLAS